MTQRKFVIYGTSYGPFSGGSVVLHRLCHHLNTLGEYSCFPSKTFEQISVNPSWNENIDDSYHPDKDIVIYPEIIEGNPLNFKRVVRWALNSDLKVKDSYGKSDLVYYYCEFFYKYHFNSKLRKMEKHKVPPLTNRLYVMNSCSSSFTDKGYKREGIALLVHKAANKGISIPEPQEPYIVINPFQPLEFTREILNKVKTFISYDTASYYSVIASLCGADSVVIPERGVDKEDWKSLLPTMKYGIAYGFEDLPHARSTKTKVRDYMQELDALSLDEVKAFIENINKHYD